MRLPFLLALPRLRGVTDQRRTADRIPWLTRRVPWFSFPNKALISLFATASVSPLLRFGRRSGVNYKNSPVVVQNENHLEKTASPATTADQPLCLRESFSDMDFELCWDDQFRFLGCDAVSANVLDVPIVPAEIHEFVMQENIAAVNCKPRYRRGRTVRRHPVKATIGGSTPAAADASAQMGTRAGFDARQRIGESNWHRREDSQTPTSQRVSTIVGLTRRKSACARGRAAKATELFHSLSRRVRLPQGLLSGIG